MLEAKISAQVFRRIFDSLKDLVVESNIEFSGDGMELQAIDSAHVALVHVKLSAEAFKSFRCDSRLLIGVNFNNMAKILRTANLTDTLTMRYVDDKMEMDDSMQTCSDSLTLLFEDTETQRVAEYRLKLMNLDQESLGIPESDYKNRFLMTSAAFQRMCNSNLGEALTLSMNKDEVCCESSSDMGDLKITYRTDSKTDAKPDLLSLDCQEKMEVPFSSKYMISFAKAAPLAPSVNICLSMDEPIMIEFPLDQEAGHVRFYLAPKTEE